MCKPEQNDLAAINDTINENLNHKIVKRENHEQTSPIGKAKFRNANRPRYFEFESWLLLPPQR